MNAHAEVQRAHSRAGLAALRNIGGVQAVVGLGLLVAPRSATRAVCGDTAAPPSWIVRLLGARMSAQGVAIAARPSALVALAGATADGSHAASMLLIPRWAPRYRRAAMCSAGVAAAFSAALTVCAGPSSGPLLARAQLARLRRSDDEADRTGDR